MKADLLQGRQRLLRYVDPTLEEVKFIGERRFHRGAHGCARLTAAEDQDARRPGQGTRQTERRIAKRLAHQRAWLDGIHGRLPDGPRVLRARRHVGHPQQTSPGSKALDRSALRGNTRTA